MDSIRERALQAALELMRGTGINQANQLLEEARKIEVYLRGEDSVAPKTNPHPAAVHGLAN